MSILLCWLHATGKYLCGNETILISLDIQILVRLQENVKQEDSCNIWCTDDQIDTGVLCVRKVTMNKGYVCTQYQTLKCANGDICTHHQGNLDKHRFEYYTYHLWRLEWPLNLLCIALTRRCTWNVPHEWEISFHSKQNWNTLGLLAWL